MAAFPASLAPKQDTQFYGIKLEDKAQRTEMEGGYVVSRAKHTRPPRKTFTTGFSYLSMAERVVLQNFYNDHGGGSKIFDWTDPTDGITYAVRFKGELDFKYAGRGTNFRFDVSFELEQA